jgi:transcription elongation factor Elf1
MLWHPTKITCPRCEHLAQTVEVCFRADYKVQVEAYCGKCQVALSADFEVSELITSCLNEDFTAKFEQMEVKGRPC